VQTECLDHFIVFNLEDLNNLVQSHVNFYQLYRPHQGVGNVLLTESPAPPESIPMKSELRCEQVLGGLLKHYHRKAA
jgi:putative transposase